MSVALTDQIQLAYLLANATEKRLFNESSFEWIVRRQIEEQLELLRNVANGLCDAK